MRKIPITNKSLIANQIKISTPTNIFSVKPPFLTRIYYTPLLGKYYFISEERRFFPNRINFKYQIFIEKIYAGTKDFFEKNKVSCTFKEAISEGHLRDVVHLDSKPVIELNRDYIEACIKQKRDHFLAGLTIYIVTPLGGLEEDDMPKKEVRNALLSLVNPKVETIIDGYEFVSVTKYLDNILWQEIDAHEPFRLISYDDYRKKIRLISEFIENKCFKKCSEQEKLKDFTALTEIQDYDNPLNETISYLINEIGEYLRRNREIKRCARCGTPFIFKADKKHCSDECRKKKDNRLDYERNYEKRRAQNRKAVERYRNPIEDPKEVQLRKNKAERVARNVEKTINEGAY